MAAIQLKFWYIVYFPAWRDWKTYPKFWGGLSKTTHHRTSVLLAVETCTLTNNAIIYGRLHNGHMTVYNEKWGIFQKSMWAGTVNCESTLPGLYTFVASFLGLPNIQTANCPNFPTQARASVSAFQASSLMLVHWVNTSDILDWLHACCLWVSKCQAWMERWWLLLHCLFAFSTDLLFIQWCITLLHNYSLKWSYLKLLISIHLQQDAICVGLYSKTSLIRAAWDQRVSVTKKMPITAGEISWEICILEKPDEGGALGANYVVACWIHKSCTCDRHTQLDQEQEINFVWPKIPGRRRCPLVRRLNKGGFTVNT